MKALVISGGGSKGAFAGGVAQYLIKDCQKKYDIFIGTSAGWLPNFVSAIILKAAMLCIIMLAQTGKILTRCQR